MVRCGSQQPWHLGVPFSLPLAEISWNDGQLLLQRLQRSSLSATLFTPY